MSDEAGTWLRYAEENLQSARLLLEHGLLNPCLQNAQQAVEKALKAILIARAIPLRRTHSIQELAHLLATNGLPSGITAEECNLLDAIYLPSKYPLGSALPDFDPDEEVCRQCVQIAERVAALARP
ncbi:MAG TPA: HEPN domain-containing protein [Candidatus Tectomicrobia bacterium]